MVQKSHPASLHHLQLKTCRYKSQLCIFTAGASTSQQVPQPSESLQVCRTHLGLSQSRERPREHHLKPNRVRNHLQHELLSKFSPEGPSEQTPAHSSPSPWRSVISIPHMPPKQQEMENTAYLNQVFSSSFSYCRQLSSSHFTSKWNFFIPLTKKPHWTAEGTCSVSWINSCSSGQQTFLCWKPVRRICARKTIQTGMILR